MKLKYIITTLLTVLLAMSAYSQTISILTLNTNSNYKAGDLDFSLAPTISSPSFFSKGIKDSTYGYDFVTEYYTSQTMGTSLLIGNRDYANGSGIDHLAALENYRLLPYPDNKYFNKFAFILSSGAEQDVVTGTTGFLVGAGIDMDCKVFTYHFRPNLSFYESFNSKSAENSTTIRFSIKLFSW